MERLYKMGIIDATWKCTHCLAVDQGKTYGDLVSYVRELYYKSDYDQRRLEKKKRLMTMQKLVKLHEKNQDNDSKNGCLGRETTASSLTR